MEAVTTQQSYSDEWRRTNPDLVVYLPPEPPYHAEAADHTMVDYTPGGDLLAIWTSASKLGGIDQHVAFSRSTDGGVNWSQKGVVAGPGPRPGQKAQWGFPVVSKSGRIYVFYNRSTGTGPPGLMAFIECSYSDDDGHTWLDGGIRFPYRKTRFDHPDPSVPPAGIIWQKPVRDSRGRQVVPLTHTTHPYALPTSDASHMGGGADDFLENRCEFLRFDNVDDGPDPKDLAYTWLPDDEELISVPVAFEPQASQGYTFCQEPGLVTLPDGRLFTAMRTVNGNIWYTVSDDDGHTWRDTEVLLYQDGGDPMLNPIAPTPLFRLQDGRYLIFLQNHDGYGHNGRGPRDLNSRRPQFLAVGEYREGARQPIWFSEPLFFCDTDMVGVFPDYMYWLSMYASLTERDGRRIFWYTDRKLFFLGRYITNEMLSGLTVPTL